MPPTTKVATSSPTYRPAGVEIRSIEDVANLANLMFRGGCQPPGIDRPEKLAVVILAGLDVGLAPTQAVGSIMLTGGKPAIYGDGALALVRSSGLLEKITEEVTGAGDDRKGICDIKRKGDSEERVFTFSMSEAKQAKLIERAAGKGPWVTYPDRMLLMRARGYAMRDVFPDVLRGLITYEEAADMLSVEVASAETSRPALSPASTQPTVQPTTDLPATAPLPQQANQSATTTEPVAEKQLDEIRRLLGAAIAAKGIGPQDVEGRKALVANALAPFGVQTGKELTAAQADTLIASLGGVQDPFTYGPK